MIDIEKMKQLALAAASSGYRVTTRLAAHANLQNMLDPSAVLELITRLEAANLTLIISEKMIQALEEKLESAEQDDALRFDSYAGVIIWLDNNRAYRKINKEHVVSEIVAGSVLTHETQRCLDEIAAMKESK